MRLVCSPLIRFSCLSAMHEKVTYVIGVCAAAIFVVGAMWAVMHPERGLQDRVAGTYLVPR